MKTKNRAVIYDFDGTIFHSPDREQGEVAYLEATGELFPFAGWWGRKESLLPPIVPESPSNEWFIEETINSYKKDAIDDQNTELILMTGRPHKNRHRIIEICNSFDLKFHKYYFQGMPGKKGRNTLEFKTNVVVEEIIHGDLKILEIWEDRPEHVSGFLDYAKKWKRQYSNLEKITIHAVGGEKYSV